MASRICVVGNSGSGKTHLARRLSRQLGLPHLELDALYHRPGWQQAPLDEFREEVRAALEDLERRHGGWIVDGNYRSRISDLLTSADTFVWLDYRRHVVAFRVVRRTIGRVLVRTELWNGNREDWRSLLKADPAENIVLWSITRHGKYRRTYEAASAQPGDVRWVRLTSPRHAERWLREQGGAP